MLRLQAFTAAEMDTVALPPLMASAWIARHSQLHIAPYHSAHKLRSVTTVA
jgi:hypothetical protein